jgi:hypothetical protein
MRKIFTFIISAVFITAFSIAAFGQTTSFVYQGKLQDAGVAANGAYQFQFKLYDAASGGNQIGEPAVDLPATVTNGIFAVNLDFGAASFNGAARFLEIGVRLSGSGQPYTVLNPRQPVSSTPYAVKSLTATEADHATTANDAGALGGIPAAQYVVTTDVRMTDARSPLPDSGYYIQNSTNQQAASNFNISGEGKAFKMTGVLVNATSEFHQGGSRVLHFNNVKSGYVGLFAGPSSTGPDNMFVGFEAGNSTTTGGFNAFVGSQSGKGNTTGFNNSFFGAYSGLSNSTGTNNAYFGANAGFTSNGSFNSFFGSNAGFSNTSGADNSFFGNGSGINNASGSGNSYFGRSAGKSVTIAANNSFFGAYAGENTTTGGNAYFGAFAGQKNTSGFANTFIGFNSGKENTGGSSNTYIGWGSGQNAGATGNNNVAIGYNAKVGTTASNAIAIGANAIASTSDTIALGNNSSSVQIAGDLNVDGPGVFDSVQVSGNTNVTGSLTASTLNIGSGDFVVPSGSDAITSERSIVINGNLVASGATLGTTKVYTLAFNALGGGGFHDLCYNDSNTELPLSSKNIAYCSSSRRYKDNIQNFTSGLTLVEKLRPVTFDWKANKMHDVGFVAEEVAEVEPLLTTYNSTGQIEGVKYAQITTALVNAVKEQQAQIKAQQQQIEALKAIICSANPTAICKPVEISNGGAQR